MAADRLEKTRELLLQAVESLRDSTSSPPPPAPERNSTPPNASQAFGCSERDVIGEHNRLFNFVFLKKVGTGGGKSASRSVKMQKLKKKRLNSWNHDFICLASTTQSKPPNYFEAGGAHEGWFREEAANPL